LLPQLFASERSLRAVNCKSTLRFAPARTLPAQLHAYALPKLFSGLFGAAMPMISGFGFGVIASEFG